MNRTVCASMEGQRYCPECKKNVYPIPSFEIGVPVILLGSMVFLSAIYRISFIWTPFILLLIAYILYAGLISPKICSECKTKENHMKPPIDDTGMLAEFDGEVSDLEPEHEDTTQQ